MFVLCNLDKRACSCLFTPLLVLVKLSVHLVISVVATCRKKPPLRAVEFIAGNKEQLEQLHKMGIRIITMKDGRVQLLHTAAEVIYL